MDFQSGNFNLKALTTSVRELLDEKDNRWLDWLDKGMESQYLNSHFYRAVQKCSNGFIREYFSFDRDVRNIIAAYTAREYKQGIKDHLVGSNELTEQLSVSRADDFDLEYISPYGGPLHRIMQLKDPVEREQKTDRLRWDKASELTVFHYFTIDVILAFLLKAGIVARWAKLDKETGMKLFRELVHEVKSTYQADKK